MRDSLPSWKGSPSRLRKAPLPTLEPSLRGSLSTKEGSEARCMGADEEVHHGTIHSAARGLTCGMCLLTRAERGRGKPHTLGAGNAETRGLRDDLLPDPGSALLLGEGNAARAGVGFIAHAAHRRARPCGELLTHSRVGASSHSSCSEPELVEARRED